MNDDTSPRLHTTADAQGAWVQLLGRWGAAELGQRTNWRALKKALSSNRISPDVGWDLESLQWLDHIGASCCGSTGSISGLRASVFLRRSAP